MFIKHTSNHFIISINCFLINDLLYTWENWSILLIKKEFSRELKLISLCFKWFTRETADKTPEDSFQPLNLVFLSGHVQQGNEQSQISHKAKRRKVQEDKQGEIEKLGRTEGTVEKLGGKREQNRYIAGSILRLNLLTPFESIF